MESWDFAFEAKCRAWVEQICAEPAGAARERAWRALMAAVAPRIEDWALRDRTLRRCRLDSVDDARTVLVAVLARLARAEFANLRRFLSQQPVEDDDAAEAELVARLARLAAPEAPDGDAADLGAHGDELEGTPLRGWLLALTRFAAKDHVKQRLGWTSVARATWRVQAEASEALRAAVAAIPGVIEVCAAGDGLEVEYLPARVRTAAIAETVARHAVVVEEPPPAGSKRALATDAERLDAVPEPGERPAMTDAMLLRAILSEIAAYLVTLPDDMRRALELWLDDHRFDEIAAVLELTAAEDARALVRAGQARLRGRFRDRWPELCAR